MKLESSLQSIASDYVRAVLRSRRAVDRILACVADVAERDEGCARAIATHPEAIAALARCASPSAKLLEAAGKRARVAASKRPAVAPYRAPRNKSKTRRRKR
ncbi:hypothetical protein [Paenibacillus sp.]|uniref:hypothetical protein n=1 Tax=Paenibacillus sp. TaxID=58172 RepID=UPI002810CB75|nr:hypothetical protein [Paenibacillus sp.]